MIWCPGIHHHAIHLRFTCTCSFIYYMRIGLISYAETLVATLMTLLQVRKLLRHAPRMMHSWAPQTKFAGSVHWAHMCRTLSICMLTHQLAK